MSAHSTKPVWIVVGLAGDGLREIFGGAGFFLEKSSAESIAATLSAGGSEHTVSALRLVHDGSVPTRLYVPAFCSRALTDSWSIYDFDDGSAFGDGDAARRRVDVMNGLALDRFHRRFLHHENAAWTNASLGKPADETIDFATWMRSEGSSHAIVVELTRSPVDAVAHERGEAKFTP